MNMSTLYVLMMQFVRYEEELPNDPLQEDAQFKYKANFSEPIPVEASNSIEYLQGVGAHWELDHQYKGYKVFGYEIKEVPFSLVMHHE